MVFIVIEYIAVKAQSFIFRKISLFFPHDKFFNTVYTLIQNFLLSLRHLHADDRH